MGFKNSKIYNRYSIIVFYSPAQILYSPLALFISPPQFIMSQQINLIYQFWIHTEAVDNLGPLEFIFNTPEHHRVHHGNKTFEVVFN